MAQSATKTTCREPAPQAPVTDTDGSDGLADGCGATPNHGMGNGLDIISRTSSDCREVPVLAKICFK